MDSGSGGPISKGYFDHIYHQEKQKGQTRRPAVTAERPSSEYEKASSGQEPSRHESLIRRVWQRLRG